MCIRDRYSIVPDSSTQGSSAATGKIVKPPGTPDPKVRLTLKTRVALVRCNHKRFAPQEFTGFIGNATIPIHRSHSLAGGRGVVWCWTCGRYAVIKPKLLCQPCPGGANASGKYTLQRLRNGLPPFGLGSWPEGDHSLFRQLRVTT